MFGIVVTRTSSAGVPDEEFGSDGRTLIDRGELLHLLDLDVLDDGTIVVAAATAGFTIEGGESVARGEESLKLAVVDINPQGAIVDEDIYEEPGGCLAARAAEIASNGSVFALWDDCAVEDLVTRGPGSFADVLQRRGTPDLRGPAADWTQEISDVLAVDLTLGPDESPHVLAGASLSERGPGNSSVVLKYSPGGTFDTGYGGLDEALEGAPVDHSVDGSGRTVVWVDDLVERGSAQWTFRRLGADGAVDNEYGTGGLAALDAPGFALAEPQPEQCLLIFLDLCTLWQVHAQADGKAIATGPSESFDRLPIVLVPEWGIGRLTAEGNPDATWDGDGFRALTFTAAESLFLSLGLSEFQPDGKVLLPFAAVNQDFGGTEPGRVLDPQPGISFGVHRLNLSPSPPGGDAGVAAAPAPGAAASTAVASAPIRQCRSRRTFRIRLRTGRRKAERSRIVSAIVRVNGRRVKVTRRARRTSQVNLTNLPRGRFTVTIRLRLADGGTVRETRRYRTCAQKIERELGPLRTRPPSRRR